MVSLSNLHLQYRLWIAEINADINVLRIFNDHLDEMSKKNDATTLKHVNKYKKQFIELRKEMDELKHDMHLVKMKLRSLLKASASPNDIEDTIRHKAFTKRYNTFRDDFSNTKQTFQTSFN